ncbi:MAG: hypothetical protein CMI16_02445 [Opitutaceae bacterium]|nr:hypothetical protein [Opitutaceae bacterium]
MSIIDHALWRNPFTGQGLRLPAGRGSEGFRMHELGAIEVDHHWQHRDVSSPFWRLFYDLNPGVWVKSSGRQFHLDQDHAIILPEGVPFDCGANVKLSHLWIHFSLPLYDHPTVTKAMEINVGKEFQEVAKKMSVMTLEKRVAQARRLGQALLHLAFVEIDTQSWEVLDPRMRRILTWLDIRLGSPITNEQLARIAGLGIEPFIRWFKKSTGQTPAVYVSARRMREASRRLAYEDETIDDIAEAVGYRNRHHFSRVFKRFAGVGPAGFRRNNMNRYD